MAYSSKGKRTTFIIITLIIFLLSLVFVIEVLALPSGGKYPPTFIYRNGMWYDTWNVTRNAWYGEDGYLPQMANQSLGNNKELAFTWGQTFKAEYPNKIERAREILKFVQRWMKYGHDSDHVIMEGKAQLEWAWNADEMAQKIKDAENSFTITRGDCEDFAFLCGIIYLGADFEVVLVSPDGHVALLIWFPEYQDANIYWDIGDGKGYGWIWVEATGDKNYLGWTPSDFTDGRFDVYPIRDTLSLEISGILFEPTQPTPESDVTVSAQVKTVEAEISQVTLIYYIEGEIPRNNVSMHFTGGSTYGGTIPKQSRGVNVTFYIQAKDTLEQIVQSNEFSYNIKRTILSIDLETLILGIIVVGIIILVLTKR